MNALKNLKRKLGKDYQFNAKLSLEKLQEILKQNDESYADEVVFVLNAGCVNIEATVFLSPEGLTIRYDCCIKDRELDGDWISYDVISDEVNLNADDMESEMFKVLDLFVAERGLSYFECNSSEIQTKKEKMINE